MGGLNFTYYNLQFHMTAAHSW